MKCMFRSILSLHIDMKQWDDAFAMKTLHPELDIDVYSPYAEWLVSQAQYEKARQAYRQAGNYECSMQLLGQLTSNAVRIFSLILVACVVINGNLQNYFYQQLHRSSFFVKLYSNV